MKKFLFLAILVLATSVAFSQSKKVMTHVVADTGAKFTDYVNVDDFLYLKSTGVLYISKVSIQISAKKNMAWVLGSSSRYGTPTFTSTTFNSKSDTNFVHTTGNEALYGNKTLYGVTTTKRVTADTLTQKVIKFTALTGSDTTYKRTGLIVIGTNLYWGNGSYYYKIKL